MTTPSDLVSISQSDLTNWAAAIESAVTALKAVLASATPLSAADESAVTQAVSDLQAIAVPTPPPAGA